MTLHAAKGLEFDLVILPGIEEGIFPTTRSVNSPMQLKKNVASFMSVLRAQKNIYSLPTQNTVIPMVK